jgi:hypothetical protein
MSVTRDDAEKFLRDNALVFVVGDIDALMQTPIPNPDPTKKYLLAVLEVR